jgi:GAF domain-containing protein
MTLPLDRESSIRPEWDVLAEILTSVASRKTVDEVLCHSLNEIARILYFHYGSILLVDWKVREIRILAHKVGNAPAEPRPWSSTQTRWPLSEGVIGWVAQHAEAQRLGDVMRDPRYRFRVWGGMGSEVAVPLMLAGRVLGVLNLESERKDDYDAYDESILRVIAPTIATALARARERERFAALEKLNQTIVTSQDEPDLFQGLIERIVTVCPYFAMGAIWLNDPEKGVLHLMGTRYGGPLRPPDRRGQRIRLDQSISGRVVRTRKPRIEYDLKHHPEFARPELARKLGLQGMLSVPIPLPNSKAALAGDLAGVIRVVGKGEDLRFTPLPFPAKRGGHTGDYLCHPRQGRWGS